MTIKKQNNSLQSCLTNMAVGECIVVGTTFKGNTVRHYASELGRELNRSYSTHYNREAKHYEITRTA